MQGNGAILPSPGSDQSIPGRLPATGQRNRRGEQMPHLRRGTTHCDGFADMVLRIAIVYQGRLRLQDLLGMAACKRSGGGIAFAEPASGTKGNYGISGMSCRRDRRGTG